jgi:hypothetical protein
MSKGNPPGSTVDGAGGVPQGKVGALELHQDNNLMFFLEQQEYFNTTISSCLNRRITYLKLTTT